MSARAPLCRVVRIGAGAGYSGDRIEPAVELAERGELDYLVFECLAERTIALAQQERQRDPARGYDPFLEARMRAVLPACRRRGIRIVTNAGAANPAAAAAMVTDIARELGLGGLRVAAVLGDDVLHLIRGDARDAAALEDGLPDDLLSANAYLGAEPIVDALADGADVVITGRVADSSLFLAPLVHAHGWAADDWTRRARGAVVGHLLECAGQVSGGYFADPGFKDVEGLARLGFPIAEVSDDGRAIVTKLAGTGGRVTTRTCTEQLLYEVHDPSAYLTPDVVVDITGATVAELAVDRVMVDGVEGRERPEMLKVSVGYRDGWIGEGQISYAGPGALARARLALEIVGERLRITGVHHRELRMDLVGLDALHGDALSRAAGEPYEVRARVAARCDSLRDAQRIGDEAETLYTNGPAGGGGVTKSSREIIAVMSTFVRRSDVHASVTWMNA
ncbi:MAG: acyclic terpene utilization AtuA family protein [Gemmatimonadaceae bacterium]